MHCVKGTVSKTDCICVLVLIFNSLRFNSLRVNRVPCFEQVNCLSFEIEFFSCYERDSTVELAKEGLLALSMQPSKEAFCETILKENRCKAPKHAQRNQRNRFYTHPVSLST